MCVGLRNTDGWASDMFNVGKLVTAVFRTDIRNLRSESDGHVCDKRTMSNSAMARSTDIWRALERCFSGVAAIVPFRVNEFKCRSYRAFAVVSTSYLNHSLAGLYAVIAIDGCTKIRHRKPLSFIVRNQAELGQLESGRTASLCTLAPVSAHTFPVAKRAARCVSNFRRNNSK
jgi:hypothetical protein